MADEYRLIPIKDLHQEDGAHELASSPDMNVWRLASALKWAFADCDDLSIEAGKETLTPEDFAKVMDLLKLRPMQFCIVLKALVGTEEIHRIMIQAIGFAKKV